MKLKDTDTLWQEAVQSWARDIRAKERGYEVDIEFAWATELADAARSLMRQQYISGYMLGYQACEKEHRP